MRVFWLFFSLFLLSGCSPSEPEKTTPIVLGTNLWPGYEMMYLAEHKGYFSQDQVDIVQHASASEVMTSLMNNKINAAALTLDEVLQVWDKNFPIEVILITDVSDGGDMLLTKPDIKSIYDLKGKTLGLEDSALGAYMYARFLQVSGLKEGDLHKKTLTIDKHADAFAAGEVDAIITFDPQAAKIKAMGANLLFSSKDIPNEIIDVVAISRGENKPSKENIEQFIAGYYRALTDFQAQSLDDIQYISQRLGISDSETEAAYQQLKLPNREESLSMMGIGGVMINSLNYMSFILEKSELIKKGCDCRDLININHIAHPVSEK
ncbi:ABC transporter substrate-binding protein [Litoribrevibacter albus]|uniref:SsuA/THI5-like domain-containing protein n=1 Tax=Litoribrevibacter albus TaxID=1473156 RepID=A0AA37S645_9GAMM|nr:ABC transporter substrate-binding protein [Litoribrevibacter albus]GLQ29572.1 hypothetical protein GCM10007876_00500 [Litoribrevibacter albus]